MQYQNKYLVLERVAACKHIYTLIWRGLMHANIYVNNLEVANKANI